VLDIAEKVNKIIPNAEIVRTAMAFQDSRNYRVTSEKAQKIFGFKPRYDVNDGIIQVVKLLSEGRIRDISNPRFSNALALDTIHKVKG
jgi:nucleoside-diphosphate-sugar epimerase